MFADFIVALNHALGVAQDPKDLTAWNVLLRGLIIFIVGILAIRFGMARFTGKETPFDILMAIVLGAVLSRSINGSAPFWPTVAVGFLLVALHALVAKLSFVWHGFGRLVKGKPFILVSNGIVNEQALKRHSITPMDLREALRLHGVQNVEDVHEARLERNGSISVIQRQAGSA